MGDRIVLSELQFALNANSAILISPVLMYGPGYLTGNFADLPAVGRSDLHSSTKPIWPACRIKIHVQANFMNTQNNTDKYGRPT